MELVMWVLSANRKACCWVSCVKCQDLSSSSRMCRRLKEEDGHGLRRSKPLLLESCSDCQENPLVTTHDTYRIHRKVNMIVIYVVLRQNARGSHIRSLQLARSFGGEIESITITVRKVWQSLPVVVGESWRELGVCARWYPSKACLLWSTPHRGVPSPKGYTVPRIEPPAWEQAFKPWARERSAQTQTTASHALNTSKVKKVRAESYRMRWSLKDTLNYVANLFWGTNYGRTCVHKAHWG